MLKKQTYLLHNYCRTFTVNFSVLQDVRERYFKVSIIISVCFLAFSKFVYILVELNQSKAD